VRRRRAPRRHAVAAKAGAADARPSSSSDAVSYSSSISTDMPLYEPTGVNPHPLLDLCIAMD
jgi:hypothetical protein